MTIDTRDALISALGNDHDKVLWDKASISSQVSGQMSSLWRATGLPAQGAIPTTAAYCTSALLGSIAITNQTAPAVGYIAWHSLTTGNANSNLEIHDRLAHMGGLVGNITTAQNVLIDLSTINAGGPVGDSRLGAADYSDVTWWLEWYTATGATVVTATVAVTYNDGTTGNLTAQSLAATRPASHMISLNALIPAAAAGKYIRGVTSVTLSATTATAGSFGVTATRVRSAIGAPIANYKVTADWAQLGLPQVANGACLFPIVLTSTTSSGTVRGGGKILFFGNGGSAAEADMV